MKSNANIMSEPEAPVSRRKALGATAIALAGGALGAIGFSRSAAAASDLPQDRLAIIGMWEIIVKFPDGLENPTLILFSESGSVVETNALTKATGVGEWHHLGGRKFDYVFWEQFFDKDNKHVSNIRVQHTLTVSADGESYTAEGVGTIFDLTGKEVTEVATTIEGRRLS